LLRFQYRHNGKVTAIVEVGSMQFVSAGEDGVLALHGSNLHIKKLMPLFETEIFDCKYHKQLGIVAASTYQYIKIVNVSGLKDSDNNLNFKILSQIDTDQGAVRSISFSNTTGESVLLASAGETHSLKLWTIEKSQVEKPKKRLQKILKYFKKFTEEKEISVEYSGTVLENIINEKITSLNFNQESDSNEIVVGTEKDQVFLLNIKLG